MSRPSLLAAYGFNRHALLVRIELSTCLAINRAFSLANILRTEKIADGGIPFLGPIHLLPRVTGITHERPRDNERQKTCSRVTIFRSHAQKYQ